MSSGEPGRFEGHDASSVSNPPTEKGSCCFTRRMRCGCLSLIAAFVIAVILFPLIPLSPHRFGGPTRATCQSNLKLLGHALQMYAEDYDGQLPSSLIGNPDAVMPDQDFFFPVETDYPSIISSLEPYIKKLNTLNENVWKCPRDDKADPMPSYVYRPCIDKASMEGIALDDYKYPAQQAIFMERLGFHSKRKDDGWRRGVELQMLFADGHAGTIELIMIPTSSVEDIENLSALTSLNPPLYFQWNRVKGTPAEPGQYDPRIYSDLSVWDVEKGKYH